MNTQYSRFVKPGRWLARLVFPVALSLVLPLSDAMALPNLTAKFENRLTALTKLPIGKWCTLVVIVENTGNQAFSNNFLVTIRPHRGSYWWDYVTGFSGIRGGECGASRNAGTAGGVDCWLRPIPPGSSVGFSFQIQPRNYSGPEAFVISVDTTGAVRESHEANAFVTALTVGGTGRCP